MSTAYKIYNPKGVYFLSFATVGWIDVFTRTLYKDILIESLKYCQEKKGLIIHAWVLMTNHVHLVSSVEEGFELVDVIRDFKKHTSKEIIKAINANEQESRKEWMLSIFKNAGAYNANNKEYQFWRQDNRPVELFSNAVIEQKIAYIHQNPVVAGFVSEPMHWLYSSALDYSGAKGLIKISFL
jgi:REP element-mobilizing transposase RayT